MKKSAAALTGLVLMVCMGSAFAVSGVVSSMGGRCIVETAYQTYSFGCCDVGVDCPQDGSGNCTVEFGGAIHNGEVDDTPFAYAVKDISPFDGNICTVVTPTDQLELKATAIKKDIKAPKKAKNTVGAI